MEPETRASGKPEEDHRARTFGTRRGRSVPRGTRSALTDTGRRREGERPAATGPGTASLTRRTAIALTWRLVSTFARFVLRFAVAIALVRLVLPEAFGIMELGMVLLGLASIIAQIGIAPAVIQRRDLSPVHIRVAFTLSVLGGVALAAGAWWGAPAAARLTRMAELAPVLRLLSLSFVFGAFGLTASALLHRRLDFKKLFSIDLVSYALGYGAVGLSLALLGYGVWSLAWATVAQAFVRTAMVLVVSRHSFRPSLDLLRARELLRFGAGASLTETANYGANNGDYFVVGRWLGSDALGLYSRAYRLMLLPISEISAALGTVLFPAFSEAQTEPHRLRRGYLTSIRASGLLVFPIVAWIAIVAPELVRGLFGPRWQGATTALQILCIGGAFRSTYHLGDVLIRARGAVYAQFLRHAAYAVVVVAGAVAASTWGIEGVAVAVVGAITLVNLLIGDLCLRLVQATWRQLVAAHVPGLLLAGLIAGAILPLTAALRRAGSADLLIVAAAGLAFLATGALVAYVFRKHALGEPIRSVLAQMKSAEASGA